MKSMQPFDLVETLPSIKQALWDGQHGIVQTFIPMLPEHQHEAALACLGVYALKNDHLAVFRWTIEQWKDVDHLVTWSSQQPPSHWSMLISIFANSSVKKDALKVLLEQGCSFDKLHQKEPLLRNLIEDDDVLAVRFFLHHLSNPWHHVDLKHQPSEVLAVKSNAMMDVLLEHHLPIHGTGNSISNWLWRQSIPHSSNNLRLLQHLVNKNIPLDWADPEPYPDGTFMPQEIGYSYLGFLLSNQTYGSPSKKDQKIVCILIQNADLDFLDQDQRDFLEEVPVYRQALSDRQKLELQHQTQSVQNPLKRHRL